MGVGGNDRRPSGEPPAFRVLHYGRSVVYTIAPYGDKTQLRIAPEKLGVSRGRWIRIRDPSGAEF